jgi:hypothetical protein
METTHMKIVVEDMKVEGADKKTHLLLHYAVGANKEVQDPENFNKDKYNVFLSEMDDIVQRAVSKAIGCPQSAPDISRYTAIIKGVT